MSPIKRVAVIGATGFVGFPISNALLDTNMFGVVVIVRTVSVGSSRIQELKSKGAEVHGVAYDNETQLVEALQGVDAVVSTLTARSIEAQAPLVRACAGSGVKLFFPSEFALELATDDTSDASVHKKRIAAMAKEHGLAVVRLFNGFFPEWYIADEFSSVYGFRPKENKIEIYGSGDEKNSWTSIYDVARFVAYILGHTPMEQLANRNLRIEGDAKSFNEFVKLWEGKHKVKLEVTYKPLAELDEKAARDPSDHGASIGREMFSGRAAKGPLANELFPNWNPKSLLEAI
ncbi:NmrA-like family domain-containing protein 1 [Ceratobasidium sp. AG-Ba]|nr:NmrA-like family domain-containing protein 1 [Ceratobasidium sp. AG-Ba]QRW04547.1 NmrA-like family domain-containing protein 1 [Ceratobasidium sp. AG-Ba]